MKNHWIKLHQAKKLRWWSAEFQDNGIRILKPRRVEVLDETPLGLSKGQLCFMFSNIGINDKELLDFLNFCAKHGMAGGYSCLRRFQGVFPIAIELESYEFVHLNFRSVKAGPTVDTVRFKFDFGLSRKHVTT
jgi:hypothetical protein